jgi:hypothetical protein
MYFLWAMYNETTNTVYTSHTVKSDDAICGMFGVRVCLRFVQAALTFGMFGEHTSFYQTKLIITGDIMASPHNFL